MPVSFKHLLVSILCCYCSFNAIAQHAIPENTDKPATSYTQTTTSTNERIIEEHALPQPDTITEITPPTIDNDVWNNLTDDEAFNYYQQPNPPSNTPSIWVKLMTNLIAFLSEQGAWIVGIVIAALVIAALYLIAKRMRLMGDNTQHNFSPNATTKPDPSQEYTSLIANAIQQQNYAQAVVYCYQHALTLLHEHKKIQVQDITTNKQILQQTRNEAYFKPLKFIIKQFEYSHFGNYPVNELQFKTFNQQYEILKNKLQ